jgi:4'-phosphopantetheinyl transferase
MSHSGKIVACAVSDAEIGIDVEEVRKVNYRVAERFFSADELADLMELQEPDKQVYFFKLWTIKESFLKAIGKGLTRSLNTFTVQKMTSGFSLSGDALSESFHVQSWQLPDNYLLACCCQQNAFPLQVEWIQIEELLKTLA